MYRLLYAFIMSAITAALMSGWVCYLNLGPNGYIKTNPHWLAAWQHGYTSSWIFAFFIVFLLAPVVERISLMIMKLIKRS